MKLQKNLQIFLVTFVLEFGLFFKFGVNWFTKQITEFEKESFKGRSEKFYEVPEGYQDKKPRQKPPGQNPPEQIL